MTSFFNFLVKNGGVVPEGFFSSIPYRTLWYTDILLWVDQIDKFPEKILNHNVKCFFQIPLGIIDCNETTNDGMIEIMQCMHKLVPGHNTEHLVRTLSFGDLLTVERQENAQEQLKDSTHLHH